MRLLFLCTGNSCRSQMAEGFARSLWGHGIDVHSAGIERHGMNPLAVRVMAEAGVDISAHHSKTLDDLSDLTFDYVLTVCGHAHETCPMFPGSATVIHHGFDDPPRLAQGLPDEQAVLDCYRRVRDEIRTWVAGLPAALEHL